MTKNWHQYQKVAPVLERTSRDGVVFHSKTELMRWEYLRLLERAGEIRNLQSQVRFELILPNAVPIMAGNRVAVYTPDFIYQEKHGKHDAPIWRDVVEDVKGYRDEGSRFRIRVFEAISGTHVRIVKKKNKGWVVE